MRFKIPALLLIFTCFICNSTDAQLEHLWKEIGYVGAHAALYNVDEQNDGYSVGIMGFYHNQLVHQHPRTWGSHISDWGILGSANYFGEPDSDLSLTLQISKGWWLDKTALLQLFVGPSWTEKNSWGASSTLLLSYLYSLSKDAINGGALFLQNEVYEDNMSGVKWRFSIGVSMGIGSINEIQ